MFSDEVISRLKLKVPAIDKIVHPDYYSYGIVQMDIKKEDGSLRQLIVNFENLTVTEPVVEILPDDVYADVLVLVNDEDMIDIACREISVEDALLKKVLRVFGDKEIGKYLITALKNILPFEKFVPRPKPEPNDDNLYFYAEGENAEDYDDEYEQHYGSGAVKQEVEKSHHRCGINF